MALNKAYDQYKTNSIFTATPEELTLMLYNGLVKFIMQAQAAMSEKELDKTNNNILRAQDIVLHLQCTLDLQYDVSHQLNLMYDYMYRRLVHANIHKDGVVLEEVLGLTKELRDTWAQAMKLAKQQVKRTDTNIAK